MSKNLGSDFDEKAAEKNEENKNSEENCCIENDVKEHNEDNSNIEEVTGSNDVEGKDYQSASETDYASDLTYKLTLDELLILFSWLSIDDLITVKRVCHSWRVAAQNKSLWRNRVLDLNCTRKPETKIKLTPNIENIEGQADNSLLDVILEYVDKLKRLDVEFSPSISPSQVRLVLEKYPQIESIMLFACNPDILECLEVLKVSPHLKEVEFHTQCSSFEYDCESNFLSIFTDSNNFPALTDLNLSRVHFENALTHPHIRDIVYNIIKNRSQQLSLLKLKLYHSDSPGVLDAISQCVRLQELHLSVRYLKANFNIERLSQLRELYLEVWGGQEANLVVTSLCGCLYNGSWSHLTKVDAIVYTHVSLLKAIVDNAKSLKSLRYIQKGYYIFDNQLENINTLLKLEKLSIFCIKITETDIEYISKCHNLKNVYLCTLDPEFNFDSSCIKYMLLNLNNLQSVTIRRMKDLKKLQLVDREEIEKYIVSIC